MKHYLYLILASIIFLSCSKSPETTDDEDVNPENDAPNILLIIADDMGLDASPGYTIGSVKPNMPNLQNLINTGIRFNNVWSNPVCTPTRSGIITGKYGYRTGVLDAGDALSNSEISLQKYIGSEYSNAVIGKWHLSRDANHPNDMGVDYFAGFLIGAVPSYYNWSLVENGQTSSSTEYTTTKFTDLAIDWVSNQTKPWFLWMAYNAPHTPFHLPPNNLHSQGSLSSDQSAINSNPLPYYMAALEALDTEMGRLINSMSQEEKDNTIIIFVGDNGTPNQVAQDYGFSKAKGTIYQGGVNVPMIISGKDVTRINQTEDALINTTDLFATIADIAGVGATEINDSKSFKTLLSSSINSNKRDYTYTEIGETTTNSDYTIRNTTHKYLYFGNGSEAFYDLGANGLENPDLLDNLPLSNTDEAIKTDLKTKLSEIRN